MDLGRGCYRLDCLSWNGRNHELLLSHFADERRRRPVHIVPTTHDLQMSFEPSGEAARLSLGS
ncbi:pantothenate transporter liz1 [Moniliophthora roreri]|nr:pantothenate transporter liz1 [Moniliophthora roreri]